MPGAATLKSLIPEIIEAGIEGTHAAVERATAKIEAGCKARSRVDTGNMRGGWQSEDLGPGAKRVFNPVDYTIFNEIGTVNMAPQPMLTPSVEEVRPEFEKDVRQAWVGAV